MGQIRIVTLMDTSSERILDFYLLETIIIILIKSSGDEDLIINPFNSNTFNPFGDGALNLGMKNTLWLETRGTTLKPIFRCTSKRHFGMVFQKLRTSEGFLFYHYNM